MLYTISQANYSELQLKSIFAQLTQQDAVVFWQDGVFCMLKSVFLLEQFPNYSYFVLEQDLIARGVTLPSLVKSQIQPISLQSLVEITEQYFPQLAL